jgi:protein O-mannosyl-transferase
MTKTSRREVLARALGLSRDHGALSSSMARQGAAETVARASQPWGTVGKTEPVCRTGAGSLALRISESSRADRSRALMVATLVVFATLPYLNMLFNGFVYDDHTQVTNNPYIQSFGHLREIFTTTVWSYVGTQGVTNYYRPLMTVGYLLCYRLFGPLAYGFHLLSLLLHVLIVCLVFGLTERMTRDRVWAFAAGALFALHPIHTESVAWIAAVTDLELTFFFLITFWLFLGVARPQGERSEAALAGMLAAFILALLSKEQALTLPALATVYEHFYREDRLQTRFSQKLARYGPLWLIAVAYLLLRLRFLGALAPVHQMRAVTSWQVAFSALALIGQYAGKLLWPARLGAFYVFHPSTNLLQPHVLAGLAALVALSALFLVLGRSRDHSVRLAGFGLIWFLATLAPVLNAHWMAANVFAERYLYLPSLGFCWLAGCGLSKLWELTAQHPARRRVFALACAGLGVLGALRIVARNREWRNDVTLYTHTLALAPDAYPILNNLGTVYWLDGSVNEAEMVWKRALALAPENAIVLNNLGLVADKKQQYEQATAFFRRAMALKPNYTDPHLDLGITYREMGLPGPAELQLRAAVALSPLSYRARNELGELLLSQGRWGEAEAQFRASVECEPNARADDFLGQLYLRRNAGSQAEHAFEAALTLNAFDSQAHLGLGRLFAAAGRGSEALRQYQAGLEADPRNAEARAALRKLQAEAAWNDE